MSALPLQTFNPDIEAITRILSNMDSETYGAAVRFIYFLDSESQKKDKNNKNLQEKFIMETSGKISVDEDAVMDLRMRSMI